MKIGWIDKYTNLIFMEDEASSKKKPPNFIGWILFLVILILIVRRIYA